MKKVSLHFRGGGSDKVYHVEMTQCATATDRYLVNFSYGRRGSTLNTGTKTPQPVVFDRADAIYERLVGEKLSKGYQITSSEDTGAIDRIMSGTARPASKKVAATPTIEVVEPRATGLIPQLLNPASEDDVETYLTDDSYCAQEKLDGRNQIVKHIKNSKTSGRLIGANKKGQSIALAQTIANDAMSVAVSFVIAGEAMGDDFYAHGMLELGSDDLRPLPYKQSYAMLQRFLSEEPILPHIKLVETAWTTAEKRAMYRRLKAERAEGIVFKKVDAPFTAGRPNSGGPQTKVKFWESLTARIRTIRPNGKESIECELRTPLGEWVSCGMTTVLKRGLLDTLSVSDFVELKYLYCLRSSGILYQSSPCISEGTGTFKRDDCDDNDCSTGQLKFKKDEE
jgi:bifunctional non-homologous end joining protein LigD